jgi:hypothetical protein
VGNQAAIDAGIKLVREVLAGNEPRLTHGWTLGDAQADWGNDDQRAEYRAFAHPNSDVVTQVQRVERTLSKDEDFAPNMDLDFLMVPRRA